MNARSAVSHLATPTTRRPAALYWLALGTFAIGTEGFMIAALLTDDRRRHPRLGRAGRPSGLDLRARVRHELAACSRRSTGRMDRRQLLIASMSLFAMLNMAAAMAHSFLALRQRECCSRSPRVSTRRTPMRSPGALVPAEQRGRAIAIVNGG